MEVSSSKLPLDAELLSSVPTESLELCCGDWLKLVDDWEVPVDEDDCDKDLSACSLGCNVKEVRPWAEICSPGRAKSGGSVTDGDRLEVGDLLLSP